MRTQLLFKMAARILATPQNVKVSSASAVGAAFGILDTAKIHTLPGINLEAIAVAAAEVFAARTPNDNSPANIITAVDAVLNLFPEIAEREKQRPE